MYVNKYIIIIWGNNILIIIYKGQKWFKRGKYRKVPQKKMIKLCIKRGIKNYQVRNSIINQEIINIICSFLWFFKFFVFMIC